MQVCKTYPATCRTRRLTHAIARTTTLKYISKHGKAQVQEQRRVHVQLHVHVQVQTQTQSQVS